MSAAYVIRAIPPEFVDRFWPLAEPFVKRALDHASGEFRPRDIQQLCREGTLRLWLIYNGSRVVAAVTAEIALYPTQRRVRVATIGGSRFDDWMPVLNEELIRTATDFGCTGIEMFVRRGFVPKLADWQYKQKHVLVVKQLESA